MKYEKEYNSQKQNHKGITYLKAKEINNQYGIDNENDKEADDILTKLENLSISSDDKSFESPLLLNRAKTFFNGKKSESKNILLYDIFLMNDNNILNDNYTSRSKTIKRETKTKSTLNTQFGLNKERKRLKSVKEKRNIRINKINNKKTQLYKKLQQINLNDNIKEIIRNRSNTISYKHINDIYNNVTNNNNDINTNIICKTKVETLNKKITDIILLIKEMKFIDKKLKKKYYIKLINDCLLKNEETNIDKIFESINELLDFIKEILNNSNKDYLLKNDNKSINQTIINLEKQIRKKDKEIGKLINDINMEKSKYENDFNSNNSEILNLKRQNKNLNIKILNFQKNISKLETTNIMLEDKISHLIMEKSNKIVFSPNYNNNNFISNHFTKIDIPSGKISYLSKRNISTNKNTLKINDKYNLSRKMNFNLVELLKKINNILCYYDSFINKECGVIKNMQNTAKNLANFIDINYLLEETKMEIFINEFMRNIDLIFNKIELYIKDVTIKIKNNSDLRHNSLMKNSSTKTILKSNKTKFNYKDNNNIKVGVNLAMGKNRKNSKLISVNIPIRKKTKNSVSNSVIKNSL